MINGSVQERDLARLVVPRLGRLAETASEFEPYRLVDADGIAEPAVDVYFAELQASGRAAATLRSYGMDLLRWFRFLWAVEVPWNRAGRIEARDFSRWIQLTAKPRRGRPETARQDVVVPASRGVNVVTGKPTPGRGYAVDTVRHSESVLRRFYDLHLELGDGPIINPFPLHSSRRGGRANTHHNVLEPFRNEHAGRYRPAAVKRLPKAIPDGLFEELFAELRWDRDRALVAFYVSAGVRASELLGMRQGDVDPGQQLITVIRKGSRASQQVPASADAFVWLRLYQQSMRGLVPVGRNQPLWWTLRRPFTPLTYHAAHRMFERVNDRLGANYRLHDLRHTAAQRMAADPAMPLTDVQWVLGHARLETTQIYTTPSKEQLVERVLAHHARQGQPRTPAVPAPGYDPVTLAALFGRQL
jgi:integrase